MFPIIVLLIPDSELIMKLLVMSEASIIIKLNSNKAFAIQLLGF